MRSQLRRALRRERTRGGRENTKISTQSGRWNPHMPPLPACARGIGQVERTYHPDRLLYPMRRTGPRGEGHWEPIDWDEALDELPHARVRAYG